VDSAWSSAPELSPGPPGRPPAWRGPLTEVDRWEWRGGGDPAAQLEGFLAEHHLAGPAHRQRGRTAVALLVGAIGCARLAGVPAGAPSPVPAVPEIAAVAYRRGGTAQAGAGSPVRVERWRPSWSDAAHAAAVERVRAAIARGELYQANVVGHRSAAHRADPRDVAAAVAALPAAGYRGLLSGDGWAVGSASPEQLVRVTGERITTGPVKGTRRIAPGAERELRDSGKDRAEHIMIVDLERNDLARVAVTGSVEVEQLYELGAWAGLWHAQSRVAARLDPDATTCDVLGALLPGGSVTGAPKQAACALLADVEPVGRGPAMGALGLLWPGGMDLGLTIRTVGVDADRVHLWAGGGITWGSQGYAEVAEAHAKAAPVMAALGAPG
jgi:para-aminobenzoate synthetase component 1